jgi:hypothetical protein
VFGSPNEAVFRRATGPQIIPQYGALFRSTPVFFMQDDHDYFDNDEATDDGYFRFNYRTQAADEIDTLEPFRVTELKRP